MNTNAKGASSKAITPLPARNWRNSSRSDITCCTFTPLRPAWRRKEASKTSAASSQSMRKDSRTMSRLRTHSMADQNR